MGGLVDIGVVFRVGWSKSLIWFSLGFLGRRWLWVLVLFLGNRDGYLVRFGVFVGLFFIVFGGFLFLFFLIDGEVEI